MEFNKLRVVSQYDILNQYSLAFLRQFAKNIGAKVGKDKDDTINNIMEKEDYVFIAIGISNIIAKEGKDGTNR